MNDVKQFLINCWKCYKVIALCSPTKVHHITLCSTVVSAPTSLFRRSHIQISVQTLFPEWGFHWFTLVSGGQCWDGTGTIKQPQVCSNLFKFIIHKHFSLHMKNICSWCHYSLISSTLVSLWWLQLPYSCGHCIGRFLPLLTGSWRPVHHQLHGAYKFCWWISMPDKVWN
jgi:hypothetical protein